MNREATAVHEAGHSVVARALGLACGEVSIVSGDPEILGHSVISDPRFAWERGDGPKRASAEAFCISLYAGAEAERAVLGSDDVGDAEDLARAEACMSWVGVRGAAYVGDDAYDRYEARLRARARLAVQINRQAIERVAAALIDQGTMTAEQVDIAISVVVTANGPGPVI